MAMQSDRNENLDSLYGMTPEESHRCQEHLMIGGGTRGGPVLHHGEKGISDIEIEDVSSAGISDNKQAAFIESPEFANR